jgi:hypothetical protein
MAAVVESMAECPIPSESSPLPAAAESSPVEAAPTAEDVPMAAADIKGTMADPEARAERLGVLRMAYKGTGFCKRSASVPLSEYIQKKRKPVREKAKKPTFEIVLDLGKRLGACRRCTCAVHEADITDGYAEAVEGCQEVFECKQSEYADSCAEYKSTHPDEVAAVAAAGLLMEEKETPDGVAAAGEKDAADEAGEPSADAQAEAPAAPDADAQDS